MSAVWHIEDVVEAGEDGQFGVKRHLREDAEHLLVEGVFGNAVVEVERSLCGPADEERGVGVRAGPGEDAAELGPIVDLFEVDLLHRCSGHDEAVEVFALHLVEEAVVGVHVLERRVFADVRTHLHQMHLERQRRSGEQSRIVGLRLNLFGHQVEDGDAQRLSRKGPFGQFE